MRMMTRFLPLCLFAVTALSRLASADVVVNGDLNTPLFPPDNWWCSPVTDAPVAATSATIISYIGAATGMHPDFGGEVQYGIQYGVVPSNTPHQWVTFMYAGESDTNAPGQPPGYPIPFEARTNTMIEGGVPGGGSSGDRHLIIVDESRRLLYETWATRWTGTNWTAGSGAIFELDTNNRRPDGWTSADAAGLAILPGLVRADDVFVASNIDHAIRCTVHGVSGYVFPSSHNAISDALSPIPLGTRLRLKSSIVTSNKPFAVRVILDAMKTYGLIVADTGSDLYFQGAPDDRWDNGVLNPQFAAIHAQDFEAIELGWNAPEPGGMHCIACAILWMVGALRRRRVVGESRRDEKQHSTGGTPAPLSTNAHSPLLPYFHLLGTLQMEQHAVYPLQILHSRGFARAWRRA